MGTSPEQIWENWKGGESNCSNCPHRDADLYFRPKLTLRDSAKVMIVGEDPNSEDRRKAKNSSDISGLTFEPRGSLSQNDYFDSVLNHNWNISRFVRCVLDQFGIHPSQLYLTNQKKCTSIGNGSDQEARKQARRRCEAYIPQEIDYLCPEVVILSGKKPVRFVNSEYGLSLSTKTASDAGDAETHDETTFVVAPNFGRFESTIAQYSRFKNKNEFFSSISKQVL